MCCLVCVLHLVEPGVHYSCHAQFKHSNIKRGLTEHKQNRKDGHLQEVYRHYCIGAQAKSKGHRGWNEEEL